MIPDTLATVAKNAGRACSPQSDCGNPINIGVGNKHQQEQDYRSPVASGPSLFRTYNSSLDESASMGVSWRSNYARSVSSNSNGQTGAAKNSVATATRGDGKRFDFHQTGDGAPWVPDGDVSAKLTLLGVDSKGAPIDWRLVNDDDEIETYKNGLLSSVVDRTGRSLTLVYSCQQIKQDDPACPVPTPSNVAPIANLLLSVTDHTGRQLTFTYDATARLATVGVPGGTQINYEYTSITNIASNLTKVTYTVTGAQTASRRYLYGEAANVSPTPDPGVRYTSALTGLLDENAGRHATWKYDAQGRASSSERGAGADKLTASYGADGSATVVDAMETSRVFGFRTTWNAARNTAVTGKPCIGCKAGLAYDANGNVASEDDFIGNRTCRVSDPARNLETTRVEGLAVAQECAAVTAAGAALPAGSRKVSTEWHPDWRLRKRVAEPGRRTTYVYNGQPDPFDGGVTATCAPGTALLPDGKPIAVLCRRVEQATTDTDGHLGFDAVLESGVARREQQWTYDPHGQVLTYDGPRTDLVDLTTYAYYADTAFTGTDPDAVGHTVGDLQSVTDPAGNLTRYTLYDKHGNLLQSVDPNGVASDFRYDLQQRLTSSSVAGQTTTYAYDLAGQLKKVTLPDASYVGYEYDAAHRLTAVFDNKGNRIEYTLDAAGYRTAEKAKDPGGVLARQLTRVISEQGRVHYITGLETAP